MKRKKRTKDLVKLLGVTEKSIKYHKEKKLQEFVPNVHWTYAEKADPGGGLHPLEWGIEGFLKLLFFAKPTPQVRIWREWMIRICKPILEQSNLTYEQFYEEEKKVFEKKEPEWEELIEQHLESICLCCGRLLTNVNSQKDNRGYLCITGRCKCQTKARVNLS